MLSDFGVSQLKGTQTDTITGKAGGTPYTMAPELASGHFSTKADLYSLCATIYLLVNKGILSDAMPKSRVKSDGKSIAYKKRMSPPLNCSKELQKLLVNGLEFNKKKRKHKSAEELKTAFQNIQYIHAKEAYDNAKKLEKYQKENNRDIQSVEANPHSDIYQIIDELEK